MTIKTSKFQYDNQVIKSEDGKFYSYDSDCQFIIVDLPEGETVIRIEDRPEFDTLEMAYGLGGPLADVNDHIRLNGNREGQITGARILSEALTDEFLFEEIPADAPIMAELIVEAV